MDAELGFCSVAVCSTGFEAGVESFVNRTSCQAGFPLYQVADNKILFPSATPSANELPAPFPSAPKKQFVVLSGQ